MAPDWGLLPTGFYAPTEAEIRAEIERDFRAEFGASVPVHAKSVNGRLIGIWSRLLSLAWEGERALWSAQVPDNAEGVSLEALCGITGTLKQLATSSTVTLTLTGTATTVIPAGSTASDELTSFATVEDATLAAVDAWAADTTYEIGDFVTNNSNVYICTTGGVSDSSGGPDGTDEAIVDNDVVWRFCGEGDGVATAEDAEATETGIREAPSGTVTTIDTPVAGWLGVVNLEDATPGLADDTDAALRVRREDELTGRQGPAHEKIRAALAALDGVTQVIVFSNVTDDEDADGVPPHSVEAVVRGGDEDEIRAALFANVAEGIRCYGNTTGTVTDSEGYEHEIDFSRPDDVDIYVEIHVTKDASEYPTDGAAQIKAAIVAFGDRSRLGKDAVSSAISAQAFTVDGVLDVTACYIGTSPSPVTETTVEIESREVAVYDTLRITVVAVSGTP